LVKLTGVLAILALVAASCGGGKTNKVTTGSQGGSIIVGAEQWPDCMNPITECASAFWQTIMEWQILPRLASYDFQGNLVASDLITEVPTIANGGVKSDPTNKANPFTLTFHLNPKAVWNDGTQITSKDIEFTWKAIGHTKGAYATTGYDKITSIDTTDPLTAVIHFGSVYADWFDLFGGNQFGVIEAAKFATLDSAKPDISKLFSTGNLTFSGGPWVQQDFSTTKATFVRNEKFWGHKPLLSQMTFVSEKDQTTEITDLLSGTIDVAFPQPGNASILKQLASNPNAKSVAGTGNFYEALWLNNQDPSGVLSDVKVRQAFMYGVDRQQIINGLIHLNAPDAQILNCGPYALPGRGPWCSGTQDTPWSVVSYDPAKSISILKGDGWNCSKVPASPCTKAGKSLTLSYRYCNGNARRGTTFDLVKNTVLKAGFAFSHTSQGNDCTSPLFTQTLPHGGDAKSTGAASLFQIADYAQGPLAVDPSPTGNFACNTIPNTANGFGGANIQFFCNAQADALMKESDKQLDPVARRATLDQVWKIMFDQAAFLPIYNLPNVTIWRSDKLAGPVGAANGSPFGTFINSDTWYCAHAVTGTTPC
jgi:peptide/nickel transport system substrate-binding protein